MLYATLAQVKLALGTNSTSDDALISQKLEEASRLWDTNPELCSAYPNYFLKEDVLNEVIPGQVNTEGMILAFPKKSKINSVSKVEYRRSPRESWIEVDPSFVEIDNIKLKIYANLFSRGSLTLRISYNGGHSLTPADLPGDIINAVILLTVRLYKEEKTGLSDVIGVAELGTSVYTKALPQRALKHANTYRRMFS